MPNNQQPKTFFQRYQFPVLLALLAIGWFTALEVQSLHGEEPRRGLVALEMALSGNYLQPTIQGEPYYNKPPLFAWIMAGFFKLFGSSDTIVRLPSLLAYIAWGYVHYRITRAYLNKKTALYGLLFFYTAVHYLFYGTVLSGELDLLYGFVVYLQGITIYHFYQEKRWLPLYLISYLLVSVGFLLKGLPSIAFQGITLFALGIVGLPNDPAQSPGPRSVRRTCERPGKQANLTLPKRLKKTLTFWFNWQHLTGALLGLLPIAIYFYTYHEAYGTGHRYLFNLLEEASQKSAFESGPGRIIKQLAGFPIQYFADHLPWSLLLPYGIYKGWHRTALEHPFLRYCVLFFAANILLYWFSPGTRLRYVYGLTPFFLTPLAYWCARFGPVRPGIIWGLCIALAVGRIGYNVLLQPLHEEAKYKLAVYDAISTDALKFAEGGPIYSCCGPDYTYVNPSVAGFTLLRDTFTSPQEIPYLVHLNLLRERGEITPFVTAADQPGVYITRDSSLGEELGVYEVQHNITVRLFRVE